MIKRETGFSLLELLIVMLIMGFVLTASSEMFVSLLRGYKQQSKIAETNIEGIIGLELLRRDIESAGYGLPWLIPAGTTYSEATNVPAAAYNDSNANPPRAVLSDVVTAAGYVSGSDYLVVKAINVARNAASTKWTNLLISGVTPTTTIWDPTTENLSLSDRVIVISPGATALNSRVLSGPSGPINLGTPLQMSGVAAFADPDTTRRETRIVYGVAPADGVNPLIMPFNRADYSVRTDVDIPKRCAPGTGVLMKAIVNPSNGGFDGFNVLPLLDCVADMQVVNFLDTTVPPDGVGDVFSNANSLSVAASATAAQTIRGQLKAVHVYILTHEGQRDTGYTHSTNTMIWVGVPNSTMFGRSFDLAANITNWQNYRWKVYTLVVRPNNLR